MTPIPLSEGQGWAFTTGGQMPDEPPRMMVDEPWNDEKERIVREHQVRGFQLLHWSGDITFLEELAPEKIILYGHSLTDLSFLNRCTTLRELRVDGPVHTIDFTAFPLLERLHINDPKQRSNFSKCTGLKLLNAAGTQFADFTPLGEMSELRDLFFASKQMKSLKGLDRLKSLRRLTLVDYKLPTLGGIETAGGLRHLRLFDVNNLTDLAAVSKLTNLIWLEFDSRTKLQDFAPIAELSKLQRLDLTVPAILTLSFLRELKQIRSFALWGEYKPARIVDNDTSPLLDLPHLEFVAFPAKPAYSHTKEQVQNSIRARNCTPADRTPYIDIIC